MTQKRLNVKVPLFALLVAIVGAHQARAQTEPVPFTLGFPLFFNFAPPGARATSLGASFIGLADDATAAAANPAGLTILVEPEVSGHFRLSGLTLEQPGAYLTDNMISQQRTTYPSFFSGVLPVRRGALSVYYLEEANFQARFVEPTQGRTDLGPFQDPALGAAFPGSQTFRYTEREDVVVRQLGFAGAFKVSPTLSIGGSFRYSMADLNAEIVEDYDQPSVDARFGNYFTRTIAVNDSDKDVTFNVGVMFKPTTKFSAGAVYRQGADHQVVGTVTDLFLGASDVATVPVRFAIPDSYGFGVAIRPQESVTIAVDIARIEYSDLGQGRAGGNPVSDATELHAGVEYVLLLGRDALPLSLRGGFFTDPDHDEFDDIDSGQVHGTFGVGVVFQRKYQLDFALNLSKNINEGLISFVARF